MIYFSFHFHVSAGESVPSCPDRRSHPSSFSSPSPHLHPPLLCPAYHLDNKRTVGTKCHLAAILVWLLKGPILGDNKNRNAQKDSTNTIPCILFQSNKNNLNCRSRRRKRDKELSNGKECGLPQLYIFARNPLVHFDSSHLWSHFRRKSSKSSRCWTALLSAERTRLLPRVPGALK